MKTIKRNSKKSILFFIFSFIIISLPFIQVFSQNGKDDCTIEKHIEDGYYAAIWSVIDNGDNTYTIQIKVRNDGSGGDKELSHASFEATPGTYSDVDVVDKSSNFNYGSIDLGPNLGGDPFQGFKVDNTGGIGNGVDGWFIVEYTLDSPFQDQYVLVKHGGNRDQVQFFASEFQQVLTCMTPTDNDGDGVPDDDDDYPDDPDRAFDNYYPAGGYGTLAYEDLWPGKGDYDFNDLVCDYRFQMVTNSSNFVVEIFGSFIVKAFGAGFQNGFGFQLANDNVDESDITVTGYDLQEGYITLNGNGTEAGQSKPTIIAYDNTYNLMEHPGQGIGVNTDPFASYVTPDTVAITMDIADNTYTLAQIDIPNFNPFIIVNLERGVEVHLPDYEPTDLVDVSYFGTIDDDTDPSTGKYYKTENNLPWAINIYESFEYPKEKVEIIDTYLHFVEWAESGGILYTDWYNNTNSGYRNDANIYVVP